MEMENGAARIRTTEVNRGARHARVKHGELRSGTSGQKVKNRKQAVAIALSEAGASNQQTPKENKEHLRHTKAKERRGETAKDEAEGRRSHRPTAK
jgi:hypothetical protein